MFVDRVPTHFAMMMSSIFVPDVLYTGCCYSREGEFSITGVPSGSYMLEASHPTFLFPRYRIDITSKGIYETKSHSMSSINAFDGDIL